MISPLFKISPRAFMVFNFLSFQCAWFAAITLQQQGILILIAILVSHFLVSRYRIRDWYTLIIITCIGSVIDLISAYAGMFVFNQESFLPLWLLLLWANFALTFHYSMSWLMRCPLLIQSMLGGFFGTLSYFSAYKLGAVDYNFDTWVTLLILALIWTLILPVYVFIASILKEKVYVRET